MKSHLRRVHPVVALLLIEVRFGPDLFLVRFLRRRDDPLTDRLQITSELRILDLRGLERLVHVSRVIDDRSIGRAAEIYRDEKERNEREREQICSMHSNDPLPTI